MTDLVELVARALFAEHETRAGPVRYNCSWQDLPQHIRLSFRRSADHALSALREAGVLSEWRPIDECPEILDQALLWSPDWSAPVFSTRRANDGSWWEGDWDFELKPTHFMHLPQPPEETEGRS